MMESVQIKLHNPKQILYERFAAELILPAVSTVILILFYFAYIGVSVMPVLASVAFFAFHYYCFVKQSDE